MFISNASMSLVKDTVRASALANFEFFANTVLAAQLGLELCVCVQDVFEDRADFLLRTDRPRAVAIALASWLNAQGVQVLCNIQLPQHEVLQWLDFEPSCALKDAQSASLEVAKDSVRIQWL